MTKIFIQKEESGNIQSSLDYFLKQGFAKDVKILDVGCNYGSLIYNLYNLGYKNVKGIDINKESLKKGQEEYKLISKRISYYLGDKIPFKNESFDVVLMLDVIEHIPDVQTFLKEEVFRVLKQGGVFAFQTPNKWINITWVYIDNRFNPFVRWWKVHCSLQTPRTLKKILTSSNFSEIVLEKQNILTNHNLKKVRRKLGIVGIILLKLLNKLPLCLTSNIWGSAKK
jgi:2-polyprenyl-3-methyl-5-hydroxy-6-metoxy-1,4-benzoquinol methylase